MARSGPCHGLKSVVFLQKRCQFASAPAGFDVSFRIFPRIGRKVCEALVVFVQRVIVGVEKNLEAQQRGFQPRLVAGHFVEAALPLNGSFADLVQNLSLGHEEKR